MKLETPYVTSGRPPKLDQDTAGIIVEAIAAGNFYKTAAALAGVCYETFNNWMRWGEEGKEPYAGLFQAVLHAEGKAESRHLRNITQAGDFGDWRASAWFLSRRWAGQRWHEERTVMHTGEVRQKHVILVDTLDREDLAESEDSTPGRLPNGEIETSAARALPVPEKRPSQSGDGVTSVEGQGVRGELPAPSPGEEEP